MALDLVKIFSLKLDSSSSIKYLAEIGTVGTSVLV